MRTAAHTGQFEWAFKVIEQMWGPCVRSPLYQGRLMRFLLHFTRARLLLKHFVADGRRGDPRQPVRADLRALQAIKSSPVLTWLGSLQARVSYLRGDKAEAIALLRKASAAFAERNAMEEAALATLAVGYLVSGAEGLELIAAAHAQLQALGVVNPLAMLRATYPEIALDAGL